MNNTKVFLGAFLVSLPFWWGINLFEKNLNDLFFLKEISKTPQIFAAQISPVLKPFKLKNVKDPEIAARSVIAIFVDNQGKKQTIFEKNSDEKLPIASLTKLITALIVLENYDLSREIKISKKAVNQPEAFGALEEGKILKVEYLLYPLLIESSNDAAFALANDYDGTVEELRSSSSIAAARTVEEFHSSSSIAAARMTGRKFIEMMNSKALELGLENTHFYNSSGLEPDTKNPEINRSTAKDLAELTQSLLKMPKVWEILSTSEYNLYGPVLKNTNELLSDQSVKWRDEIVGGKTGYAEKAGGCMILVTKAPKDKGFLITVVLGTKNSNAKFQETKRLVDWARSAYRW